MRISFTVQMIYQLLIFGCVLGPAMTFRVDAGCEAKQEYKEEIMWDEFNIGAWLSSDKDAQLELLMEFEHQELILDNDNIKLSMERYKFIKTRDMEKTDHSVDIPIMIKGGWTDFFFSVNNSNYKLWYVDNNENHLILEEYKEFKLISVTIRGSNVTLNCPKNLRMWHVSENPSIIPLDNSEEHRLSFFSNGHMIPSITLGQREFSFGWDNQTITTLEHKSLPPFRLYNITITCNTNRNTKCSIKEDVYGQILEDVRLIKAPHFALIKKSFASPFQVLLSREELYSPPHEGQDTLIPKPPTPCNCKASSMVLIMLTTIIVILAVCLAYCIFRWYKTKVELANELSNRGTTTTSIESSSLLLSSEEDNATQSVHGLRVNDSYGDPTEPGKDNWNNTTDAASPGSTKHKVHGLRVNDSYGDPTEQGKDKLNKTTDAASPGSTKHNDTSSLGKLNTRTDFDDKKSSWESRSTRGERNDTSSLGKLNTRTDFGDKKSFWESRLTLGEINVRERKVLTSSSHL